MSIQSVIFILFMGLMPNANSASDDIYQSIEQVKLKLQNTSSFEIRKKDFMKFNGHICMKRQQLRAKVFAARKEFAADQISSAEMDAIDLERYNYYDLCDFLKELPLSQNKPLPQNSCEGFLNDLKRSSNLDVKVGEDLIKDLNLQATLIGKLLYRCKP